MFANIEQSSIAYSVVIWYRIWMNYPEKDYQAFTRLELDPSLVKLSSDMANDYCADECPVKDSLKSRKLACPFIIREALKDEFVLPITNATLAEVAASTWLHCVADMKRGDEPVVLLGSDQPSYPQLEEYL